MAKYLILYHSKSKASERMASATPEEMKAGMDSWMKWKAEVGDKLGFDWGLPVQGSVLIKKDGETDSESDVSGYSTMEGAAEEIAEALESHPHLDEEGNVIEVLEMLP